MLCISCFKDSHHQSWPSSRVHLSAPSPMLLWYKHSGLLRVKDVSIEICVVTLWMYIHCTVVHCFAFTVFQANKTSDDISSLITE